MADVCNVDAQLIAAVFQLLQADGVVDVLRLGRVDGEDGDGAQVHAVGGFGLVDGGVVVGTGFLQDLRRELQADVAAIQDGLGALGGVVGGTELLDDSSAVGVMTLAAVGNQEADLITQVHALAALLGQQELDIAAAVGLDGQTAILGQADSAGKAVVRHGGLPELRPQRNLPRGDGRTA